jgi:hypothetical protein
VPLALLGPAAGLDHRLGFLAAPALGGQLDVGPDLVGAEVAAVDQQALLATLDRVDVADQDDVDDSVQVGDDVGRRCSILPEPAV